MNDLKKIFFLLFYLSSFVALGQTQTIDIETKGLSLELIIDQLEKEYGFLFSYKEDDVQGVQILRSATKGRIEVFLNSLLSEKDLSFELVQDNYIILKKTDFSENKDKPKLTICGIIIDSLTQSPLPYANIYLHKSQVGTSTEDDGSFQFATSFEMTDTLIVSYVGYQEKRLVAAAFTKKPCQQISLNYLDFGDDFVVVTDYLTDGISLNDHGAYTVLRPDRIGALPGQVEPDILSTIKFLPGISSPDGSASNINVRGGTPDQNLVLWEDIPIYHSAHYFGMISAFDPYIIDKVSVHRGGFDARYGGRISGVIDMRSEDNVDQSNFGAGANFLNVYTNGKLSLLKNKASVIYSLRRSISELWRTPTFEHITTRIHQGVLLQIPILNKLPKGIHITDDFNFWDSRIKVNYQLSDKDQLSLAWFYGNNDFQSEIKEDLKQQKQTDSLFLKNNGLSFSWTHQWSPAFSTKLLGINSSYNYDYKYNVVTLSQDGLNKNGIKTSKINERQIHLLNSYETATHHRFKLGYQLVNYEVAYQIRRISRMDNQTDENLNRNSNLNVLYAMYSSPKEKRFGLDVGVRANHFQKEQDFYLEPRFRLWYKHNDDLNFYINAGKYYQFLSQLIEIEGDRASIEMPVWTLTGNREVPVLDAIQYQFGMIYHKNSWLFDVQTYYKKLNGLSSLASGFDEDLSNQYNLGNAVVKGIDILVKKRWKNYQTWLSYSFSNVNYRFDTFFDQSFSAPNEQPHVLSWVNTFKTGKWHCSLGWTLASGSPYSLRDYYSVRINNSGPDSQERIFPEVNEFNSERLPFKHQLDASISYTFLPKNEETWKAVIGLSVLNIYNQRNIYDRSFFIDAKPNTPPELIYTDKADIGITPNVVMRIEW